MSNFGLNSNMVLAKIWVKSKFGLSHNLVLTKTIYGQIFGCTTLLPTIFGSKGIYFALKIFATKKPY